MTNSENAQVSSKKIDVIRAWMQTQWERIPAVPHSQPGSYARGYDGGLVDVLRGLQATLDKLPPALETGCVGCGGTGSDARPFQLACKVGHIGPFKDEHGYYEKRRLPSGPLQRAIDCKHENARIECTACGIDLTGRYSQKAVELRPWECPHCGTLDPYAHAETCSIVNR